MFFSRFCTSLLVVLTIIREVFFVAEDIYFMDKFNVTSARYAMMFSYENLYGIMRAGEFVKDADKSRYYNLISLDIHKNVRVDDVLLDICFYEKSGKLSLNINDIICIRISGKLFAYRYMHKPQNTSIDLDCFSPVEDFFDDEINEYIRQIHEEDYVLNIPDGKLYSINDKDFKNKHVFCIEGEQFKNAKNYINYTFSLYGLFGFSIKNMDPYGRPFISLSNALYFFNRDKGKDRQSLLLLNRKELEMLKDHYELNNIEMAMY